MVKEGGGEGETGLLGGGEGECHEPSYFSQGGGRCLCLVCDCGRRLIWSQDLHLFLSYLGSAALLRRGATFQCFGGGASSYLAAKQGTPYTQEDVNPFHPQSTYVLSLQTVGQMI